MRLEEYLPRVGLFSLVNSRERHPDYSVAFIAGALAQALVRWHERGYDLAPAELAEVVEGLIVGKPVMRSYASFSGVVQFQILVLHDRGMHMSKSETLQLRLDSRDMQYLRAASESSQVSLSEFVRRVLEAHIVSAKIAEIARDFPFITSVRMFGSMARGEQTADSDIDIAIDTDAPYKWMGERGMGRFVSRIEETVGRSVDVVKAKYCGDALAEEIVRDGRVVYVR